MNLQNVFDILRPGSPAAEEAPYMSGLCVGIALSILVLIIVWLINSIVRRRRGCQEIRIPGENGDLIVSCNYLRSFVERRLESFPEAALASLRVKSEKERVDLAVGVNLVQADVVIPQLRERIKQVMISNVSDKIGIDLNRVDILIVGDTCPRKARKSESAAPAAPFTNLEDNISEEPENEKD